MGLSLVTASEIHVLAWCKNSLLSAFVEAAAALLAAIEKARANENPIDYSWITLTKDLAAVHSPYSASLLTIGGTKSKATCD